MTCEGVCSRCDCEIMGPPVVDQESIWWTGSSSEYCSVECQDNAAEAAGMRAYAAYWEQDNYMGEETYRRDMIDAGRGHLLR